MEADKRYSLRHRHESALNQQVDSCLKMYATASASASSFYVIFSTESLPDFSNENSCQK
jgi:hypothetical protein